jgi:small subunit ribosomal protein S20
LVKKSSLKRVRQSAKIRLRNRQRKSEIKTEINKFKEVIGKKDLELAKKLLIKCTSLIDKAESKNVFHKRKANRIKSQLSKKLNDLSQSLQ